MKLFLVRHGQTTANQQKIYAGQTDVLLTEQGRQEAESIRPILEKFTFDRVYSSDLTRARRTAEALPFTLLVYVQTAVLLVPAIPLLGGFAAKMNFAVASVSESVNTGMTLFVLALSSVLNADKNP